MKPVHTIKRRDSRKIFVGDVAIGGDAPISVQSMTNTNTIDVDSTLKQIRSIEKAGADLVRVSIPTMEAADAFKEIKKQANIPLITDIHFDYKIALKVAEYGADCLRINPGNIGREDRVREVVALVRVNTAMLDTMLVGGFLRDAARNVAWLEELGGTWLPNNRHWYELNSFCYAVKDSYPPACPLFQTAAVAARMLHTHPESEGFFEECDEILRFVERCQRAEEPRTQPVSDIQRLHMDEEPA